MVAFKEIRLSTFTITMGVHNGHKSLNIGSISK